MTKPIILVKICYKLLYVIQGVENSCDKVTSWPQLISEFLVYLYCGLYIVSRIVVLKLVPIVFTCFV